MQKKNEIKSLTKHELSPHVLYFKFNSQLKL